MSSRYESLMDVVRSRMTNRAFAPAAIPRAHVEMILADLSLPLGTHEITATLPDAGGQRSATIAVRCHRS